jgi:hypothetical protein
MIDLRDALRLRLIYTGVTPLGVGVIMSRVSEQFPHPSRLFIWSKGDCSATVFLPPKSAVLDDLFDKYATTEFFSS